MAKQTTEPVVASSKGDGGTLAPAPDREAMIISSDTGKTMVMETVVAKIAGLAVREVSGVHALVPWGAGQAISSLAKSLRGAELKDLGVRVEVGTTECAVDARIVTEYGASIPKISDQIRVNVCQRVQNMTGLIVKELNITVVDLYFDEPRAAPVTVGRELK